MSRYIISLFCRISSLLQGSFAKETYHFKEPTKRSHPIWGAYLAKNLLVAPCALLQRTVETKKWDLN